jgi:hypothetical protein
MAIKIMKELERQFQIHGVSTLLVKFLSPKQDNDNNQIYLGTSLAVNLFPVQRTTYSVSKSTKKRTSDDTVFKATCALLTITAYCTYIQYFVFESLMSRSCYSSVKSLMTTT